MTKITGGCLCGAVRYQAEGQPLYAGHCYCADCRKASGSGFIPFMGFAATQINFTGETQTFISKSATGTPATRNFCKTCGALIFGGERGKDTEFTIYAGSLDNASQFHPTIAIFTEGHPDWALVPAGLKVFARGPG